MVKFVKSGVVFIFLNVLFFCLNIYFMVIWILMEYFFINFFLKLNCGYLIKSRKLKLKLFFFFKLLIDLFKLRLFRWFLFYL